MAKNKSIFMLGLLAFNGLAFAQYHKTLPKGVRVGVYKNVQAEVNSSFNQANSEAPISYKIKGDSEFLDSLDDETIQSALDILRDYPDAYSKLNLGTYKVEGKANINVDGYGLAYGITNKLTVYTAVPVYKANVKLKYKRSEQNSYGDVSDILQNNTGDDFAQAIGTFLDQYSGQLDVNSNFLQNLVTNGFGYEEVGDWQGEGLGDIELGMMYNFLTRRNYGLKATFGTIAPTGRVDDPDVIQDIGFGDGQWDLFAEVGGSYLLTNRITLSSYFRYTYQFASDKTLRVPYGKDVNLGDESTNYNEKLGNKALINFSASYALNDWASISSSYEYENIGKAKYTADNSEYAYSESYLAANSNSTSHNLRVAAELSSVTLYTQKKFILPGSIGFAYQRMLYGTNTEKVDRYELEFRMFF